MKEVDDKIFLILRKNVETTFGKKICYSKDCTALSIEITKVTNRLISETTLKRVWNLVNSKFNPSKYTLDTLALYLGFSDWEVFTEHTLPKKEISNITMWETIKKRSYEISHYSLDAIKSRMGENYEKAFQRKFFEDKIIEFVSNDKVATAFIAPGGYGKSLLITKVVEKFFLAENPVYPNDIVWYIDCGSLDLIESENFKIEGLFLELLGYSPYKSFNEFFASHPDDIKGKMFLIVDGLNELSSNYLKLESIISDIIKIIEKNQFTHWFKVILTCRNNIWNIFERKLSNQDILQNLWYDINFNADFHSFTNIPTLTEHEINKILQINKIKTTFENIKLNDLASYDIIRIPYFLYLYIQIIQKNQKISDIDLLKEFINNKISGERYKYKINIIYKILEKNELGLYNNITKIDELKDIIEDNESDYADLLKQGIIFEKNIVTKYLQQKISIQFTHEILYEFLIANYWLEHYKLTKNLFVKIFDYYQNSPTLMYNILIWIIKYAFKENNIEVIKSIYSFIENNLFKNEKWNENQTLIYNLLFSVGSEIRKYPNIQKEILGFYASNRYAVKYYFEEFCDKDFLIHFFGDAIDNYIEANNQVERQTFGYYIKFSKNYYKNEIDEIHSVFEKMSSLDFENSDHFTFNYYLSCKILYQCLFSGKADTQVVDYIKNIEQDFIKNQEQDIITMNYNVIAVVEAFNLTGMHDHAIEFANGIFKHYRLSEKAKQSRFYTYLKLFYADSLLQIGKEKEAFEIFRKINIYADELYTLNSKFFWLMRFLNIKANFLIHTKDYLKAIEIYEEVIVYAKLLNFTRIEKQCKTRIKEIKEKNISD